MLKGYVEEIPDTLLVGARDKENGREGPVAHVTYDDDWLWISTDEYEGTTMLNIEALPALRRALTIIARDRKVAAKQERTDVHA